MNIFVFISNENSFVHCDDVRHDPSGNKIINGSIMLKTAYRQAWSGRHGARSWPRQDMSDS
jgi:hypothetical protein